MAISFSYYSGLHGITAIAHDRRMSYEILRVLAKNAHTIRKSKSPKMGQEKLAELAKVHKNTILKIEKGRAYGVEIDTLLSIAGALQVNICELLVDNDDALSNELNLLISTPIGKTLIPAELAKLRAMETVIAPAKATEQDFYILLQMIRSKSQNKKEDT